MAEIIKISSYNLMWISVIFLVCIANLIESDPIVDTKLGKIRGSILISDNNNEFYAFRGISFAKPPVNQLRFKPPVPVNEWHDTLDATENGHACIQYDIFRNIITGDEDCLYLNVYTKQLTTSSLKPVMVFIHGGAFNSGEGSSRLYGPERLLDKDIVLVTINYRVSALGFLSTEDSESPGNYGLLDQVEALKWVQNHVGNFGGDPNSVTIFGESAGSASVAFHLISPLSKGLFHGAIGHSGTATSIWAVQTEPLNQAKLLAEALNCPTNSSEKLVDCLRKSAALDIMIKSSMLGLTNPTIANSKLLQFQPVIDKGFGALSEFLPEHPTSMLANQQFNKVPVIFGNVKNEGYIFLLFFSMNVGGPQNFEKENVVTSLSAFNEGYQKYSSTYEKLTTEYFKDVDFNDTHQRILTFTDLIGDIIISADIDSSVKSFVDNGFPTYAYRLTYHGENSISSQFSSDLKENYFQTLKLVAHLDDLQYLFRVGFFPNNLNEQDKQTAEKMVTLWTNFAKNKVPSLEGSNINDESFEWKPVQPNQTLQYLNISQELSMEEGAFSSRPDLWGKTQ